MTEQLCQIWRRCAPPFFCYLRKTDGGGTYVPPPPAVRGLKVRQKVGGPVNIAGPPTPESGEAMAPPAPPVPTPMVRVAPNALPGVPECHPTFGQPR